MAITTAQIFVKTDRVDRLLRSVEAYLAEWAKAVRSQWPDVRFIGRETSRNTFVLPPIEGWCCLLDPDRYHVDSDLAVRLSRALDATSVAFQIRGGELSWSYAVYENGVRTREDREPEEAFGPVPADGSGPMPVYPDPTLESIRALRVEGVPHAYCLLAQEDLVDGARPDEPGSVWVDEIVAHPERRKAVERRLRAPYGLGRPPGRAPFPPDMDTTRTDHHRLFVEIRSLWGRPDHQAIDNLLEIERADRNRLLEPFFGEPDTRVPVIRFEYTSRGMPDEELATMLDRRRSSFQRCRPTKMAFLLEAVVTAKAEHPEWKNLRVDGFGLRFEFDGIEESVDLGLPYEEFMEGRLIATAPEQALRTFLGRAAQDLAAARGAGEFDSVRGLLAPCLVRSDEAARLERNAVVTRAIGHGVNVAVSCQVGDGSALLDLDDLSRWNVSFDAAVEAAAENLDRSVAEGKAGVTPVEIAPGRRALASFSTEQPASFVVAPGMARLLREVLRAEGILVAVPDGASFFAIAAGDPEMERTLRAFTRERMLAADEPLTAELFRLTESGLREA